MPEQSPPTQPYAIQYTEGGKTSRKALPPEAQAVLPDVMDMLLADPNAYPGRTRLLDPEGNIQLYQHPTPRLEVMFRLDTSRRVLFLLHVVEPRLPITKPVFISYSHKDAQWLVKLKQFLRPLEDRGLIRVWDDTEIRPGSDWLADIRTALGSARVAVFLITQDFLDSSFIREKELPVLLEAAQIRGCLIFWIAVSSTTFEDSPLARFQSANAPSKPLDLLTDAEQNQVLAEIYKKMKTAVNVN